MASGSKKVIYAAMIGNALIAVTKFVAASLTGSSAMLSEGIHSAVDTTNQVLLLYGLKRSKRAPDENFPFGYGKEIYFWSFVVAIMIFTIGAGVSIWEGVDRIKHPHVIHNIVVNYVVLFLAFIFEGCAWFMALKEFRKRHGGTNLLKAITKAKDPAVFVVLFEDSAAMLGLIIAFFGLFLGSLTGNAIYDGIASILIGVVLAGTAIWLAFETKGLLIGESANHPIVKEIRETAESFTEIAHVNEVLTMHMGPEFLLVNLSIDFVSDISADYLEQTIHRLDQEIKKKFPIAQRIFIESESRYRKTS